MTTGDRSPVAVKIKLKRIGKIRVPQYRIVVADARTRRSGRAIEELGIYQPKDDPSLIRVDSQRVQHWLSVGAQPTEPVVAILKVTGDWQKFKGLPGVEGTLRVAAEKVDKLVVFDAASKDALAEKDRVDQMRAKVARKAREDRAAAATAQAAVSAQAASEPAGAPAQPLAQPPASEPATAPATEPAAETKAEAAAEKAAADAKAESAADEAKAEG